LIKENNKLLIKPIPKKTEANTFKLISVLGNSNLIPTETVKVVTKNVKLPMLKIILFGLL
jgi:hypothetical protein